MTKCTPNSCGYMHNHKNCVYTGVLYFQDGIGSIQFSNENIIPESIMLYEPSEYNLYNSDMNFDGGLNVQDIILLLNIIID